MKIEVFRFVKGCNMAIFKIICYFIFCSFFSIFAENIILKNGSVIKGNIVELSDDGIKVQFSKAGSLATFLWDELEENFARKIYFNLFRKQFNTENYILGIEIKKYKSDKVIKGVSIKQFSGSDFIYVKTKGKLVKLNRDNIEYIKPIGLSIFEIYSEKEIYMQVLQKRFVYGNPMHKMLASKFRRYNMKIYKLHLMLYLIGQFNDLKSHAVYNPFNVLFKRAIDSKDVCVFDYLLNRNWNTITFKKMYDEFVYVANKCGYQDSITISEQFEEKEFIVYSLLYNNLLNFYIISFLNQPIKNLDSLVDKEFDTKVRELSLIFGKDKKYIYKLWNSRRFNMFKIDGCSIVNNVDRFYPNWGRINNSLKYLLMVNTFINRYLKLIGHSITKQHFNISCYQYVVK